MSEQFKAYVTGTSFALTLSKNMIDMLCQMDRFGYTYAGVGTARSLHDRGLAEWAPTSENISDLPPADFRRFRLTEAGRAVIPLLKLSGLYIEYPIYEAVDLPPTQVTIRRKDPQA